jgi:hypothetical protein
MGKDSDIAILGNAMKEVKRQRRKQYGVPCPQCAIVRPRAQASILLPGQRCKVDKYRDPRPRITREQEDALWAEQGFTRVDPEKPS